MQEPELQITGSAFSSAQPRNNVVHVIQIEALIGNGAVVINRGEWCHCNVRHIRGAGLRRTRINRKLNGPCYGGDDMEFMKRGIHCGHRSSPRLGTAYSAYPKPRSIGG